MNTRELVESIEKVVFTVDLTDVEEIWGTNTTYYQGFGSINGKQFEVDCSDRSGGGVFELFHQPEARKLVDDKLRELGLDPKDDEVQDDFCDGTMDVAMGCGSKVYVTWDGEQFQCEDEPTGDHEISYGGVTHDPSKTRYVDWHGQGPLPDEYRNR